MLATATLIAYCLLSVCIHSIPTTESNPSLPKGFSPATSLGSMYRAWAKLLVSSSSKTWTDNGICSVSACRSCNAGELACTITSGLPLDREEDRSNHDSATDD